MTQNTPLATFNVIKGWLFYTNNRQMPYEKRLIAPAPIEEFYGFIEEQSAALPTNTVELTGFLLRPLMVEE